MEESQGISEGERNQSHQGELSDPTRFEGLLESDRIILQEAEAMVYEKGRKSTLYYVPTVEELQQTGVPDPKTFFTYLNFYNDYLTAHALRDKFGADENARDAWKKPIELNGSDEEKKSLNEVYKKDNQFRGNTIQVITMSLQLLAHKYFQQDKAHPNYIFLRDLGLSLSKDVDELEEEVLESEEKGIPYDNEIYYQKRLKIVQNIEDAIEDVFQTVLPDSLLQWELIDVT